MTKLFGTDGIRGRAGTYPLDLTTLQALGRSLAQRLAGKNNRAARIIIGRDTRESGPWIERVISEAAIKAGAQCDNAGIISTPGIAFLTSRLNLDAGIVISASHNPYYDNGIKIFSSDGSKLDDKTERLLEADIGTESRIITMNGKHPVSSDIGVHEKSDLSLLYANYLVEKIGHGLQLNGLKIVIDCAHGAASLLAKDVFERLGGCVYLINAAPNGQNINFNSGSLHLSDLQRQVKESVAAIGVAFDGDADRALFVDSTGEIVDGDAVLWILANYLDQRGELSRGLVIATVMSNIGLELALQSRHWKLKRTDVGDKYVLEELLKTGAALGGEQSGHVIFPALSLAGDGMQTAILILHAMQADKKSRPPHIYTPLHDLVKGFTRYPQILLNVRVKEKFPFAESADIVATMRMIEERLKGQGRLVLRYSGTEPLARVMIEGPEQEMINQLAQQLAEKIEKAFGQ